MYEAIDYSALGRVRQELDEALGRSCSLLGEFAAGRENAACLQDCATSLNRVRTLLQAAGLRGADRLVAEMQGLIAALAEGARAELLDGLMEAFLQLPGYLSHLQPPQAANPAALLPLINRLRELHGEAALVARELFAADLTSVLPAGVFTARAADPEEIIRGRARSARARFQAGLLEWYRGADGNAGLVAVHEVLAEMQQDAGRSSVARLWWAAACVCAAMIAGEIPDNQEIRQLFGQLDRQIKRLADAGEAAFEDPPAVELMQRLLYCIAGTASSLPCMQSIKATYRLAEPAAADTDAETETETDGAASDAGSRSVYLHQGRQALAREARQELARVKAAMDEFSRSAHDFERVAGVPRLLTGVRGALQLSGQERAAAAAGRLRDYIATEFLVHQRAPGGSQLELLADALSGIEYALSEPGREHVDGERMLAVAEESLAILGYACTPLPADESHAAGEAAQPPLQCTDPVPANTLSAETAGSAETPPVSELQVIDADADEEIVAIFLEEAGEVLAQLDAQMPAWFAAVDDQQALQEVRRGFHTLKGGGRMVGALAAGEFAWAFENLLNRIIEDSIAADGEVQQLLAASLPAMRQLLARISDADAVVDADVDALAGRALRLSRTGRLAGAAAETAAEASAGQAAAGEVAAEASAEPASVHEVAASAEPASAEETAAEASAELAAAEAAAATAGAEDDPQQLEIYIAECREHLSQVEAFLASGTAPCRVTEPLYRSLHTIAGISATADIAAVMPLAARLNDYFADLYQSQQQAGAAALEVLRDAAAEISRLVGQLPDMSGDAALRQELCARLQALAEGGAAQTTDAPYAEVDADLLEIFIEEASEIIDAGENTLRAWSEQPGSAELMVEFQRQLHTLKGGARMVGITPIGDLSHTLESLLTRVADGQIEIDAELFVLLHDSHDHLAEMLEHVKAREIPAAAGTLTRVIAGLQPDSAAGAVVPHEHEGTAEAVTAPHDGAGVEPLSDVAAGPLATAAAETAGAPAMEPDVVAAAAHETLAGGAADAVADGAAADVAVAAPAAAMRPAPGPLPPPVERRQKPRVRSEQVRVRADLLDNMVNHAAEINIYRARMEQQISDYRHNLVELDQTIGRLREQLRQLEMETEAHILFRFEHDGEAARQDFDPLEMDRYSKLQQLSRSLIESIGDLRSLQGLMENTTRESEALFLQQSRVSADLQDGLLHSRMIPFAGLAPRLRRVLRQSAKELGKEVELNLEGADGEMDRTVIDRIVAPLEHMLRNAVAHGIEAPELRKQHGKPVAGVVKISFSREGSEIVLRIDDDGAGLDIAAIRRRAIDRGLLDPAAELADSDIMQFVLETGFSTAAEVTQLSGRGVGMDVVSGEVRRLGGSLHISSVAGAGTCFTIRLPYTLAVNQVLLVKAGEETFCLPLGGIEGVARLLPGEIAGCYQAADGRIEYAGNAYQLQHLGSLLGCGTLEQGMQQGRIPVLLTRLGDKRIAFQLEAIIGSREIVIKPLGAQLQGVSGISGATILGDGRVALILDLMSLARLQGRAGAPAASAPAGGAERLHVMVVDDSITVRKVTSRLLERNGFKVLTAKDGVDALGQLRESVPDMMLLDIEMPRMDGFELATHMRNDERLRHVPIIMITSRSGDKHREHAKQIGVNIYLGKPYQESDLLDSIQSLIDADSREACA